MNSPSTTTEIAPADQERLARILDEYLVAIEQGQSVTPEELLARHPADAPQLRGYLSGLNLFHAAAIEPNGNPQRDEQHSTEIPASLQTIGDYRLVRELGRGGMGVVYEAWQLSLRRRVALKVLPFTSAQNAKHLGRFKNEAQAAAQVQHPNIVPVYAIGEDCGTNYYVMQLIEGQSLTSLLNALRSPGKAPCDITVRNNGLTYNSQRAGGYLEPTGHQSPASPPMRATDTADHIRVVARLGIQAAEALHAAHEYGVVHRDVKPSNLLLDDQGKLWVTDFGLARCRDDQGLTQSGDVLGTMRYMSPEQAQGRLSLVDHRTDIYSLGLTLYELATLNHPDDEAGEVAKLFERQRAAPKPLRHWNRNIPSDFQTIVLKCLGEFPHERYATAKELADDLQRLLEGRPILASPPSLASRVTKWAKRRRGVVYATAAVLAVAIVAIVTSSILLSRERSAHFAADQRTIKDRLRDESSRLRAVYDRVADELVPIPGAEAVTRRMLQDGVEDYERLVRQIGEDPLFVADAARAQGALGTLHAKLGNRPGAIEAHSKAKETWERALAREPNNSDYEQNLALSLNNLALLIADDGRLPEAVAMLTRAAELQTTLKDEEPSSVEIAADLATTHSNLGLIYLKAQHRDTAAREFRLAIQDPLVNNASTDAARRALAASYNNLASLLSDSDPAAAADAYKKAITFDRDLVKSTPVNRNYQFELARAYNNLGSLASKNNDWKNAQVCHANAIEIRENLVRLSPQVAAYRNDLAMSYNNLGMAQSRSDHFSEAEASFQKALQLIDTLLQTSPSDAQLLSSQGNLWNNLAMLRDRQLRPTEAVTAYKKAIESQVGALQLSDNNETFRAMLSRHYFNYAHNLVTQKKFDDALQIMLKRKDLWAGNPERLFSVVQEFAVVYHQFTDDPAATITKDKFAQAAVVTLRDALDKGLDANRLQDASLAELAHHAAFRQLLDERKASISASECKNSPKISRVN